MQDSSRKQISFSRIIITICNNTIGIGALAVPVILSTFGCISLFATLIAAVSFCIFTYSLAMLGLKVIQSGNEITWFNCASIGLGKFYAKISCFLYYLGITFSNFFIARFITDQLHLLFLDLNIEASKTLTVLCVILMMAINYCLLRYFANTALLVGVTTSFILKILILTVISVFAIFHFKATNLVLLSKDSPGVFVSLASALQVSMFTFIGLESGIYLSKVASEPKLMPRAMVISSCIVGFIYTTFLLFFLGAMPQALIKQGESITILLRYLFPNSTLVNISSKFAIIIACFAGFIVWCFSTMQLATDCIESRVLPGQIFAYKLDYNAISSGVIMILILFSFLNNLKLEFIASCAVGLIMLSLLILEFSLLNCILRDSKISQVDNKSTYSSLITCILSISVILFMTLSILKNLISVFW